jgi:ABC-type transporter MlaC component
MQAGKRKVSIFTSGHAVQMVISAACLLISAAASASPVVTTARDPAEAFVEQRLKVGYAILTDQTLTEEQRRMQFRDFVLSATDMQRIALFTLGFYAGKSNAIELKKFEDTYMEHAVVVYSAWLNRYRGETFTITGSARRAPDDVTVNADFIDPSDPNGPHSRVSFEVRKRSDGRLAICDMRFGGIWLALSERGDFGEFLEHHNGSVAALTGNLQSVARAIVFDPRAAARE